MVDQRLSGNVIYERIIRETEVARQWWQLAPQTRLPLTDGNSCLLLYPGQPGGQAGPDVRDVVLTFLPSATSQAESKSASHAPEARPSDRTLTGDVEFHVRAADWFTHDHHTDPRYNRVLLHVVFYPDSERATQRQDGTVIPTCSLLDLVREPSQSPAWPCQQRPLAPAAMTTTLLTAGLFRLHEKSRSLGHALSSIHVPADAPFNRYDSCLLPALAEGLGYGRDSQFFRSVGLLLAGLTTRLPEPLGRTPAPPPLDARRLRILAALSQRWQDTGIWKSLLPIFQQELDVKSAREALRAAFLPLNRARTDIIICNTVLPFALAVAHLEDDRPLAARAQQLYLAYPGLVSNRVTRTMSEQLQLPTEPEQACLQQGLHYIYRQTCQAKDCQNCLCGGQRL